MNAPINATRSPIQTFASSADLVGYLVAWQFARPGFNEGEFEAPRATVEALFAQYGFAGCVDARRADPMDALMTASRRGDKHGCLVEAMPKKNKDAKLVIGVYFQNPQEGEVGDEWILGARVRVESTWDAAAPNAVDACVARGPELAPSAEQSLSALYVEGCKVAAKVAEDIAKRANKLMTMTQNTELSEAILAAGAACHWAPFRKAGGVYWVPMTERAENFRKLLLALEPVSLFWPTVQPLFGDADGLTLRNVGAAAESAMLAEIESLTNDLAKAETDKKMRTSTIEARRVRCQELVVQAQIYRSVLAEKVDKFGVTLKAVHARYGTLIGEIGDDAAFEGFDTV